jgi:hypothetical protein
MHWVGKENSSQSQVFQPLGLGEWAGSAASTLIHSQQVPKGLFLQQQFETPNISLFPCLWSIQEQTCFLILRYMRPRNTEFIHQEHSSWFTSIVLHLNFPFVVIMELLVFDIWIPHFCSIYIPDFVWWYPHLVQSLICCCYMSHPPLLTIFSDGHMFGDMQRVGGTSIWFNYNMVVVGWYSSRLPDLWVDDIPNSEVCALFSIVDETWIIFPHSFHT